MASGETLLCAIQYFPPYEPGAKGGTSSKSCIRASTEKMPSPQIRTLRRALETLGADELALALQISVDQLDSYLKGEALLGNDVYLKALDIVASRPRTER